MRTLLLVIALVACSSHEDASVTKHRAFALQPGQVEHTFDLLSAPIAPGAKVETGAEVRWPHYQGCSMVLPADVQAAFSDAYLSDDMHGHVIAHGTNGGTVEMRFTAAVTCDADIRGQ